MKNFIAPIATDAGLMAQMAYFTSGSPIVLTKMAMGSGKPSDPSEIPQMRALLNEELEIPIAEVTLESNNPHVTVCGIVDYMKVDTPFNACELGLYIEDPQTNTEVLYCYTYSENVELAPAKVNATEMINITTLISRTQDIVIDNYNKIPYVLRDEFNLLREIVSDTVPDQVCGFWLKPFDGNNVKELWDDYDPLFQNLSATGSSVNLWAYFGNTPPQNANSLWFQNV